MSITSRKNSQRRYRAEHKEKGLCNYCNKTAKDGKRNCEFHLNKSKEWKKNKFYNHNKSAYKAMI